jgi:hypothetical protein
VDASLLDSITNHGEHANAAMPIQPNGISSPTGYPTCKVKDGDVVVSICF